MIASRLKVKGNSLPEVSTENYFQRYYSAILGRVGLPRSIFYVYVSDNQRGAEKGGNSGILNRFCFSGGVALTYKYLKRSERGDGNTSQGWGSETISNARACSVIFFLFLLFVVGVIVVGGGGG